MRIKSTYSCAFLNDRRGGVAIFFSLSLVALAMASGLAIDYARSMSTYDALQQDLDSTLLYLGRHQLQGRDNSFNAQEAGTAYMNGLRRSKHTVGDLQLVVTEPEAGRLVAKATVSVPTSFSKLFGVTTIPLEVGAEVAMGEQPVEVALVLDNTGSMAGSKIEALKAASRTLIETAFAADNSDQNIKIGIVPFSNYVNVGLSNRNQSWLGDAADSTVTQPQVCIMQQPVIGQTNCRTVTTVIYNDGIPTDHSYQQCDNIFGPPQEYCYTPTTINTWHGCVGSRNYPLNTKDEDYDVKIPAIMNFYCPKEITPLTNDRSTLDYSVGIMLATGETYIPGGLIWGQRLLSKEAPYTEATDYNERINGQKVRKILVLMTDGLNTLSPNYPYHQGADTALSNNLTAEICTNIKAKGIQIYSVAFQVPDETTKTMLQTCASGPSNYFDAEDEQKLQDSFEEIAKDFNPLRLTR